MQGHGCINVETAHLDLTEGRLTHGVVKSGCYVVIAVTDTGPGIDDAILENLFDPFFTTRATGNGLGLATVREIVYEHGGAINVSSHPGRAAASRSGCLAECWDEPECPGVPKSRLGVARQYSC